MRTNAIDSLAWRSLCEYQNLMNILIKLNDNDFQEHSEEVMNYTTKLYELDEAKTIRTYHMEMMKKLIERINLCIDEIKTFKINVVKLGD